MGGWGEEKGKERNTYTHAWQWMCCAALRCNGCATTQCAAMEWKWVGILLLSFLVSSCFFLFEERARLIGAAAAAIAIAGC